MKKTLLITLVAMTTLATSAFADRPLVTETPNAVAVGTVQVEAGTTYSRGGAVKTLSAGELVVTTGVSKNSEVSVSQNYFSVRNGARGLTDSAVNFKYQFTPNAAVIIGTSLPTGSRNFRNSYQPGITLAVGKALNSKTNVLSNVGYTRSETIGVRSNTVLGSLAVTRDTKVGLAFAEVYGANDNRFNDSSAVAVGLARQVSNGVRVDGRVGRSLNNVGQPNYFVGVGLTITR
jgi:hypothetical protein